MATGDKLFLADKQTLDSVKQDTTSILTKSDEAKQLLQDNQTGINEVKSSISTLPSRVATPDYYKTSDISKFKSQTITIDGSIRNILSLTTPGTLYYAIVMSYTNGLTITTTITIDGQVLMNNASFSTASQLGVGIISAPMIAGVNNSNNLIVASGGISVNGGLSPLLMNSSNTNMFSIKPIKWDSSLVIRSYVSAGTATSCYLYVYYSLD